MSFIDTNETKIISNQQPAQFIFFQKHQVENITSIEA
jgi:hypothetical protein